MAKAPNDSKGIAIGFLQCISRAAEVGAAIAGTEGEALGVHQVAQLSGRKVMHVTSAASDIG
jgi:hypothetical protein